MAQDSPTLSIHCVCAGRRQQRKVRCRPWRHAGLALGVSRFRFFIEIDRNYVMVSTIEIKDSIGGEKKNIYIQVLASKLEYHQKLDLSQ